MQKTDQGTLLDLYIKPQSKRFQITIEQNELTVHCTETPVKGKVNRELIKELTKLFKKDSPSSLALHQNRKES